MAHKNDICEIPGIGPKKEAVLQKMNIKSKQDLLFSYPREYQDRRSVLAVADAMEGETVIISGKVVATASQFVRSGRRIFRVKVDDGTGTLEILFFNAMYIAKAITRGEDYEFYGKITLVGGRKTMTHPEFCRAGEGVRGIVPIYPLTAGISQKEMQKWHRYLAADLEVEDYLPHWILKEYQLYPLEDALRFIHFPQNDEELMHARRRLIFDELFLFQLAMVSVRKKNQASQRGIAFKYTEPDGLTEKDYISRMPFELTEAQARTAREVISDMESPDIMNRLVQGDVGSGKTAIAEIAMFKAARCGMQSVLMAPTEILARQHYEGIGEKFREYGIECGFLSGKMKAAEKRNVLERIASGEISVVIGTHAVIQKDVEFNKLGLVITDEQHRFGVNQREMLSSKGQHPDRIVMTATPIPRTLAVVLYGELDVSRIDQMPAGRKPVKTRAVTAKDRDKVYSFVNDQLEKKRQAYVVTPLIEESDKVAARSVTEVYDELRRKFKKYNVALLHGEMKQQEKDDVMSRFYSGEIDVLVATVVIEVGINVPNASIMVIENAERFGLSQLHQLRGRVGRGKNQSFCCLILDTNSEVALERGKIMEQSTDGFFIANEDLKLRGPGEIFGTRQHGLPQMKIADPVRDLKTLTAANAIALKILEDDVNLEKPENKGLRQKLDRLYEDFSVITI